MAKQNEPSNRKKFIDVVNKHFQDDPLINCGLIIETKMTAAEQLAYYHLMHVLAKCGSTPLSGDT